MDLSGFTQTSTMASLINQTDNSSEANTTVQAYKRDEQLVRVEVAIQAFIFCLAVFGNACVLFALRHGKRKTSRMHLFIMHLCIADMLVAFLNILPQMLWDVTFRFKGNDFLCRTVKYLQVMVIYLSTYILVMTAIDRYRAICHPLSSYSWAPRKVHIMVAIAWGLALVLSAPQIALFQMQEVKQGSGEFDCWAHFYPEWTVKVYITSFCMSVYIVPSCILIVLYGRISFAVWRNVYRGRSGQSSSDSTSGRSRHEHVPSACSSGAKNVGNSFSGKHTGTITYKFNGTGQISVLTENSSPAHHRGSEGRRHHFRGMSRAKMKTIKLTFVVIIAYLVCWSPFIITQMWWAYDSQAPYNSSTFVICLLLASLNSCCNPWIYVAFSSNLIQQTVPCCRTVCRRRPKTKRKTQHPLAVGAKGAPVAPKTGSRKTLLENIQLQAINKSSSPNNKSKSKLPWLNKTTVFSRTTSTKLSAVLHPNDVTIPKSRPPNANSREKRHHVMKGCDCPACKNLIGQEKPVLPNGQPEERCLPVEGSPETPIRNGAKRRANSSYPFLFYKPFNYEKVEMKCTSV